LELVEVGAFWLAVAAWVAELEAALLELSLEPVSTWALVGSRVPHWDLMSVLQSSCFFELAVLAAMQSE
jgi:hypothetical protein